MRCGGSIAQGEKGGRKSRDLSCCLTAVTSMAVRLSAERLFDCSVLLNEGVIKNDVV